MGFGGPVWHVSIQHPNAAIAVRIAKQELQGVGNAALGEWEEFGNIAFHLRRRLSETEEKLVGPVADIRGTSEAYRRWKALPNSIRKIVDPI